MRLERQQCRGHALARKMNDQNRVVGRHTVKRTRVITDRHVPSLATHASPRGVGVHRAFDLENDEQLVGAARGQWRAPAS